jgi:hypothetical protein
MLEWNDGNWSHNAYWGANSISYGTDGTASRRFMGPLPATGQWVQLKVPASQVALEGRVVKGMGFALYNGRATWDAAGVLNPNISTNSNGGGSSTNNSIVTVSATDASRIGPSPGTFTVTRTGSTSNSLTVNYSLAGTATSGVDYQTQGAATASLTSLAAPSITIPAGATSATLGILPTTTTTAAGDQTVVLSLSSGANYSLNSPASATMTLAGNAVFNPSLTFIASKPTLSWATTKGAVYRVAYKNKLNDAVWTYTGTDLTAMDNQFSWTDPGADGQQQRFYLIIRLR